MTKKILMVLTSHDELGNTGNKTGFWVEEFAAPYYAFIDAGVEVTLATPLGGQAPIDPTSTLADFQTAATERYDADSEAQAKIATTVKLASVSAADFDGVFYPGGHGPLWDLTDNTDSITLIENFLNAEKAVATVCHASTALLNVKDVSDNFVIKGKAVTGFTNSEEAAVQLTDVVPFLLEDELIKRGAEYQKAQDFHPFAVQDGLIITGQNPASSALAAEKLLTHLSA
ncbi:type 1 glutamine amidotransferase domain-containing protein [Colwellia sp. 4_MG-2023]|jgi:putative intracellular protease/amidase|uniref:type 1 glutamine amidotransferase domain-containing protein n=1 Tax=unclassified Colwellia TaxID=196834 RepID=UPI001C08E2C1|nr:MULTISPECIES: type 1 glutamine amidotransferase domain-containing protein [unclassified Colwellia]MBU2924020.1 type 1 glutamine amidotransferase domain-containing protein [Colwellia sp. C2M11]MDO6488746.1 type 1 glutamine amidotransferase domain-containing protein [Colwellia sp. 6_MG-2023]MDO6507878.1 type 1 glutamine amidotransferase domain-containing protein [Colwellia sp. 5_MG-2023]MDO6556569.1 type 1 glutamine amidotransferase domain-containing protein [Colwellia sp. 4_MG-2023]MDO665361